MKTLAQAAKVWAAMPATSRQDAICFFLDEAKQSIDWARAEERAAQLTSGVKARSTRHRDDARAMRAAVAVLVAAGRKPR